MRLLQRLLLACRRFGIRGAISMAVAKAYPRPVLVAVRRPDLGRAVYLRSRTTDVLAYEDVVLHEAYRCDLEIDPRLIIDAGANVGLASVYFANRFPDATIIAIEPEEANFAVLLKNVQGYPRVHPIRAVLWREDGFVTLKDVGEGAWGFRASSDPGRVPAVSVPTLVDRFGIAAIDIFKLDIEGAEIEVFAAASDWVNRVRLFMIEMHDRFLPGCSDAVTHTLRGRRQWRRGEITFFL